MKRFAVALTVCCMVGLLSGAAFAAEKGIVETVAEGCKKEIDTYCKDVKPGEGRVLACLYARQDKLSGRCEYALYDAASQLERVITAITYLANECRDDLKTYCSAVKPGEGRLLDCIDRNKAKVTKRCNQAIKDVGLNK
ncbi:MAG: cysteine rich repeat-containing protein [Nitrospiraceae bacterium]|nr:cysteine rich repeat-containing protein [Nitrospiraceae bacterium]